MEKKKTVKDLRLEMLSCFSDKGCSYVDLMNAFPGPLLTRDVLQEMIDAGYVSGKCEAYSYLSLTPSGRIHLSELKDALEQEAYQAAKEKAKRRSDHFLQILQILSPLVAALLAWLLTKQFP